MESPKTRSKANQLPSNLNGTGIPKVPRLEPSNDSVASDMPMTRTNCVGPPSILYNPLKNIADGGGGKSLSPAFQNAGDRSIKGSSAAQRRL